MATSEIEQLWISQFQENLGALRKVAGLTTQQLANELGVARQTISNLETGRSPMTKLQYLALRTVFSAELVNMRERAASLNGNINITSGSKGFHIFLSVPKQNLTERRS